MKVAIVHYWLVGMRGGEAVLEELCKLFPQADLFTHVADPARLSLTLRRHKITETFIARLPFARRAYPMYLPLMPRALERLDLTGYDLVISSEAGPAKGVIVAPDATHICYCHSPMRYIWDQMPVYAESARLLSRIALRHFAHGLRVWDTTSAARVDHFIANSRFTAQRIAKAYRRDATVIHPPVAPCTPVQKRADAGYLWLGELVSYKRPDLAVQAFNASGRPLTIVGDGPERRRLQAMAGSNITFRGRVDDRQKAQALADCRALVFPGVEDFGIVPVEAAAAGKPVVAFGRGGARDTVLDGTTGVLFHEPSAVALNHAIDRLEQGPFPAQRLKTHAERFAPDMFRHRFMDLVHRAMGHPDGVRHAA